MRVDEQICPACERPRTAHHPECRYEKTMLAAQERFTEARTDFVSSLVTALREEWHLLPLIFAPLWMVVFAVDRLLL